MALNIIFAGTPEFAAVHLRALIASEHQVCAVYSQPDRPAGRGKKLQPSPVKQVALEHEIPVYQPLNFRDPAAIEELKAHHADIMIVVAYGLILPKAVLDAPRLGCLNVHASILPRWRGAAPIQRCIEAGDTETGITIMQMDVGLDTGDMLSKIFTPIHSDDTGGSLHDRLAEMGPEALLDTLKHAEAGTLTPEKQDDTLACYAHKLLKEEALIDWSQPAGVLDRRIRAFNPFPMAYCLQGEERIRVLSAQISRSSDMQPGTITGVSSDGLCVACGDGTELCITHIQLPGKKPMSVADVINGQPQRFISGQPLSGQTL